MSKGSETVQNTLILYDHLGLLVVGEVHLTLSQYQSTLHVLLSDGRHLVTIFGEADGYN